MSEVEIGAATVEVTKSAQTQETDWKAKYEETIAESRKWEQRAKDNKTAADKLAELEEASKTAEQKQAEETEALRARVAEFEARDQINGWKSEIVDGSHIPVALLRGSTREELEQHFKELVAVIPVPSSEPAPVQTVAGVGQSPNQGSENVSIDAQIQAAEKAGDKELTASLKAIKLGSVSN